MNPYDAIVILAVLLGVWRGWRSGIIRQAGGLLGVVLGGWLASSYGNTIAKWAEIESWGTEVIFIVVVLATILAMLVITYLIDKAFSSLGLGIPVRLLGVLFAVGKYFVVMSLAVGLYGYAQNHYLPKAKNADKTPTTLEQSYCYGIFGQINDYFFPEFLK